MARKYHTLLEWNVEAGRWEIAFGDYSKPVVEQEARDMKDGAYMGRRKLRIITTTHGQAEIDAKVAVLNGAPETVRLTVMRALPGSYLTAGESYTVSNPARYGNTADLRFWRDEAQCGTFVNARYVRDALRKGWIVPEVVGAAEYPRGWQYVDGGVQL